jgi:hypothetical protein
MGDFGVFCVLALIVGLVWWVARTNDQRAGQSREVVSKATFRVPGFLRSATGTGPWFELDSFYRDTFLDIKCTSCEVDRTYVSDANGKTEYADLHYRNGKTTIVRGDRILFDGNALDLLDYPQEGFPIRPGHPPPEGSDAFALYQDYMKHREAGTLDEFMEKMGAPRTKRNNG